ncbi:putative two-component response regulatory protein, response regulator receiver [Bradyrhizobium oligotrophicum S58]|uniref:Putative two-component response regulatory protein, response regulator receiver n=1 Tax=Bradyrhizobium oligotrophicum S58 TaxID=1245469 RepID=M4ZUD6_9BRAD|nr:response regulator [Bradyrhizobium oligotrophicum]BAM89925.1 putative two-component response regulatory protein, response regulator receiver [Bradyrhizobium oligotrophicum S58]
MTNILVVDDEVGVCCVIQHLLVRDGYAVTAVTDGRLAVDAVARDDFAAALIDLNLADMDGNDVIRAARAARPHMPIVMMSGMVLESGRGTPDFHGLSARVVGLHRLAKPFKPRDLSQLMRDILAQETWPLAVATMTPQ